RERLGPQDAARRTCPCPSARSITRCVSVRGARGLGLDGVHSERQPSLLLFTNRDSRSSLGKSLTGESHPWPLSRRSPLGRALCWGLRSVTSGRPPENRLSNIAISFSQRKEVTPCLDRAGRACLPLSRSWSGSPDCPTCWPERSNRRPRSPQRRR